MTRWRADRRVTVGGEILCPHVDALCVLIHFLCICVCVDKNNNCDISAAAHLRGPGEVAHKPADYLVGPAGSPIFPTQTPAVKHILLAPLRLSFSSPFSVLLFCFHFASSDSPGTFAAVTSFTCPPLLLTPSFLYFAPPPLAVSQASCQSDGSLQLLPSFCFHKLWQKECRQTGKKTNIGWK